MSTRICTSGVSIVFRFDRYVTYKVGDFRFERVYPSARRAVAAENLVNKAIAGTYPHFRLVVGHGPSRACAPI